MNSIISKSLESIQTNILALKKTLHALKQDQDSPIDDSDINKESKSDSSFSVNWSFWLTGLIVAGIGLFVYNVMDRILLIFTGMIMAIALESAISYLEGKMHRRRLAITLSYLLFVSLLLSGILIMIPFLVNQIGDLIGVIITLASHLEASLKTVGLWPMIQQNGMYGYLKSFGIDLAEPRYLEQLQSIIQNNISAIIAFSSNYAKWAGNIVVSTVSGVLATLTQIWFVLTLSVLLSIEKTSFVRFLHKISWDIPSAHKKIGMLYTKLGFWLKTQILLCIYIGIAMRIGLLVLSLFGISLPNKWSLAVIAALTEIIPYAWPLIGGIPVLIMGAVANWWFGMLIAGILIFCIQRLENNVLVPLLFKKSLGVSSVLIFVCMILLWVSMGINWVILAIPISVIITILYDKN